MFSDHHLFIWDTLNIEHISRHQVQPEEQKKHFTMNIGCHLMPTVAIWESLEQRMKAGV